MRIRDQSILNKINRENPRVPSIPPQLNKENINKA